MTDLGAVKKALQARIVSSLVCTQHDQCPSANMIHHLYADGSITVQKGGWAYGHRSEFSVMAAVRPSPLHMFVFPDCGFIVLLEEEARQLHADIGIFMAPVRNMDDIRYLYH
jgi:hypothetical protein